MGIVYRAIDTRLDREVALKFLPPGLAADETAKARFIQEAKAASSLDHANICTIYQIDELEDGRLYIAMALYDGRTLKELIADGPVGVDECVSIGRQIASALARAHGRGIVHRDIKSANIMLTDDDEVKILDFGLAKLTGGVELTQTGSTVGTAAYMSPEQVRSEAVDYKTDLWSLGIILYELATGSRPFVGEYEASVGYSILNETPKPPSYLIANVPESLDSIIGSLLAKNIADRPESAADVQKELEALQRSFGSSLERTGEGSLTSGRSGGSREGIEKKWVIGGLAITLVGVITLLIMNSEGPGDVSSSSVTDDYSIAVLPFTDLSPDTDNQYFGEGMAEELRNALMGLGALRVAARASSFYYQGKGLSPQAIGDSLNVRLVLEGTVRQEGETIRVTAELTDSDTGFGVWSNRYDRELDDVLSVQDEITQEIVRALEFELQADEAPKPTSPVKPAAYRLYLEGKFHFNKRTLADLERAQELFAQAIQIDDQYAPAYAFHSQAYAIRIDWGFVEPRVYLPLAIADARRAIELDPNLPDAYTALGLALGNDLQREAAMQNYEKALELEPDHSVAHHWKALEHFITGDMERGWFHMNRASELDPLSLIIGINQVYALSLKGEMDLSKQEYNRIRRLYGNHSGLAMRLSEGYERVGRIADAIEVLEEIEEDSPFVMLGLVRAYGRAGEKGNVRSILARVRELRLDRYIPISIDGFAYAWLGETENALRAFEQAVQEKDAVMKWFEWGFLPTEFQNNQRMRAVIAAYGLALPD